MFFSFIISFIICVIFTLEVVEVVMLFVFNLSKHFDWLDAVDLLTASLDALDSDLEEDFDILGLERTADLEVPRASMKRSDSLTTRSLTTTANKYLVNFQKYNMKDIIGNWKM